MSKVSWKHQVVGERQHIRSILPSSSVTFLKRFLFQNNDLSKMNSEVLGLEQSDDKYLKMLNAFNPEVRG